MKLIYEKEKLKTLIIKTAQKTLSMDLVWEWPCGVAYYGVLKAYHAVKEEQFIEQLIKWTKEYIKLSLPEWTVNSCAMGHTMLELYKITKEPVFLDIVKSKLEYLKQKAIRFGEGVLQHTVSSANDFPEQAWADTLFMAAYFMLRAGVEFSDEELIIDALNQYDWHIKFLQNPALGLWYHGYDNLKKNHMSGIYWARANAWAAYTMSQVKPLLNNWYLYPQCMNIECSLRDQLAALKYLQTEKGLWRTVLDDPDSYEEVSASCGIAAAMLINENPLHTPYVQKALDGVCSNISEDGRVLNVSGGTAVMKDKEGYKKVPKTWIQGWGQGLALVFLSNVLLKEEQK